MLRTKANCHEYPAWDSSAKGIGHPKDCCHQPATCKAQPLKEPQAIRELGKVGSQGVIK